MVDVNKLVIARDTLKMIAGDIDMDSNLAPEPVKAILLTAAQRLDEAMELDRTVKSNKKVIVCSAIRDPDSQHVICGVRHFDMLMRKQLKKGEHAKYKEQGFVDQFGNYHDRIGALKIAQKSGQLIQKTLPADRLFSEDVW